MVVLIHVQPVTTVTGPERRLRAPSKFYYLENEPRNCIRKILPTNTGSVTKHELTGIFAALVFSLSSVAQLGLRSFYYALTVRNRGLVLLAEGSIGI